jgi:hypothetical protein
VHRAKDLTKIAMYSQIERQNREFVKYTDKTKTFTCNHAKGALGGDLTLPEATREERHDLLGSDAACHELSGIGVPK